jgi:hypothetical protein
MKRTNRFYLFRDIDQNNLSGTGKICEGFILEDGRVVLNWLTNISSLTIHDNIDNVRKIHCHQGTRLIFIPNMNFCDCVTLLNEDELDELHKIDDKNHTTSISNHVGKNNLICYFCNRIYNGNSDLEKEYLKLNNKRICERCIYACDINGSLDISFYGIERPEK